MKWKVGRIIRLSHRKRSESFGIEFAEPLNESARMSAYTSLSFDEIHVIGRIRLVLIFASSLTP